MIFSPHSILLRNQLGAMFGLDARIAMAVFGVISVITSAYIALNINNIRGAALTDELNQMTAAIEGIHQDLQQDLYKALSNPNEQTAYQALYTPEVLNPGRPRARWLGPYVENSVDVHPRFGAVRLVKRQADHGVNCIPGVLCYLWLTLEKVPEKTFEKVNEDYDGNKEGSPATQGRVQASGVEDDVKLWFRTVRALN